MKAIKSAGLIVGIAAIVTSFYSYSILRPKRTHNQDWLDVTPQTKTDDCGAACLSMIFRYYKISISTSEIEKSVVKKDTGSTFSSLKSFADQHGLTAEGWVLQMSSLSKIKKPVIAFINSSHFVVIDSLHDNYISVRDPLNGRRKIDTTFFKEMWQGETLVFSKSANDSICDCKF
jgi:ABC-type bacteriocin/lantibiotic exporter with double-glycine peptidase domain